MDSFYKILAEIEAIHKRKAADYGSDSDSLANVRASQEFGIAPWVGVVLRTNDKMHRIKQFIRRGTLANESVRDSLLDNANYFIIALSLYDEAERERVQRRGRLGSVPSGKRTRRVANKGKGKAAHRLPRNGGKK